MDKQIQRINTPDYKRIYNDIIDEKFPHLREQCNAMLAKNEFSVLDVIEINQTLFGTSEISHKYISYQRSDIMEILSFQKKNKLNNVQTALYFKLSRNTIAKWKKIYII